MAVYPNMSTTVAGFNLISRSNATGKALIFTRGALGDGDASDKTITSLTNLVAPKMPNLAITNKRDNGNGHFTIEASVDNSELEAGFWAREMGVFAKCEGDESDVLYAYTNGGNLVPYVNDKTMPDIQLMQVDVIVGNAKNLSVTIDNSVYITEARLRTHDEDLNAHKLLATTTETPLEDFNEKLFARTGWVSKLVLKLIDKVLNALFSDTEGTLFEKAVKLIASKLVTGDVSNPNGWWIKIPAFGFNLLIQGGFTIVGANQEKSVKLPIGFKKWYVPSSVIRYDYKNRPNINMMCAYAGIEDLSTIYLSTDIIRNEDIGIPLTVFWLAVGL